MELNFTSNRKPIAVSVPIQRRQLLAKRIDQQLDYLQSMRHGSTPRAGWAWMDDAGRYFIPIKYGRQQLELKKGMFSIECSDLNECQEALGIVREMVLNGDFDDQLAKVSAEIRKKFSG